MKPILSQEKGIWQAATACTQNNAWFGEKSASEVPDEGRFSTTRQVEPRT
jgi:hypothetical protein